MTISLNGYGAHQHVHSYAECLANSSYTLLIKSLFSSNVIFLYNLSHHMVFSLWDFLVNITLPPIIGLTSIVTPFLHSVSPLRYTLFFPDMYQHHPCQSCHTQTNKFCPYMVFKYCHNI